MNRYPIIYIVIFSMILSSCGYKMKNIAIAEEIEKYYIYEFKTSASNVDQNFAFKLQEEIKTRIRQETRLKYDDLAPDIEIKANLTGFRVNISDLSATDVATENEVIATFTVNYIDNLNNANSWKKDFKERTTYSTEIDYLDAEEEIQDILIEQFSATIFNKLFNNW